LERNAKIKKKILMANIFIDNLDKELDLTEKLHKNEIEIASLSP
jgi:hypothetical protein